ncbi:Mor transcription activator family protein [Caldimonas tepidiphila]|uniref:Mor transcription activator family protein n=1 Tax=Caldimonas tepidiphila TaxID=2315841 RepID=UPI000E5AF25C|nr:Mor transcription activator family protein [Caldimonas tepidiphila]
MTPSFVDVVADGLRHFAGLPPAVAEALAAQIARSAAELGHGGGDYYLPGASHLNRAERNARIRAEYVGANVKELCRKYGLSRASIYSIVRRGRDDC